MQLLELHFDLALHPGQIRAFRAAISELVGFQHEGFHHHREIAGASHYHWSYPLIQYRISKGQVKMTGINTGAAAIKKYLLPRLGTTLHLMGKEYALSDYRVRERTVNIHLLPKFQTYRLRHWIALNPRNYRQWKKDKPEARLDLLSRALTGHLRAMGEGLALPESKTIQAKVIAVEGFGQVNWKAIPLLEFRVQFCANVQLPPNLQLGRLCSYGFGQVEMIPTAFPTKEANILELIKPGPSIEDRQIQVVNSGAE